jgi:hypothetical protein
MHPGLTGGIAAGFQSMIQLPEGLGNFSPTAPENHYQRSTLFGSHMASF